MEVQQRLLKERELKIRATLERLRRKRHLLRSQRKNKDFPSVSVMGYTNCGESQGKYFISGFMALLHHITLVVTLSKISAGLHDV